MGSPLIIQCFPSVPAGINSERSRARGDIALFVPTSLPAHLAFRRRHWMDAKFKALNRLGMIRDVRFESAAPAREAGSSLPRRASIRILPRSAGSFERECRTRPSQPNRSSRWRALATDSCGLEGSVPAPTVSRGAVVLQVVIRELAAAIFTAILRVSLPQRIWPMALPSQPLLVINHCPITPK